MIINRILIFKGTKNYWKQAIHSPPKYIFWVLVIAFLVFISPSQYGKHGCGEIPSAGLCLASHYDQQIHHPNH